MKVGPMDLRQHPQRFPDSDSSPYEDIKRIYGRRNQPRSPFSGGRSSRGYDPRLSHLDSGCTSRSPVAAGLIVHRDKNATSITRGKIDLSLSLSLSFPSPPPYARDQD